MPNQKNSILTFLRPFFVAIFMFFPIYYLHLNDHFVLPMSLFWIVKCFPIYSLIWFVCKHFSSFSDLLANKSAFLVALGLAVSSIGDIFMQDGKRRDSNFFLLGLVSFLFAHVCYIFAFPWRQFKPSLFVLIFTAGIIQTYLLFGDDVLDNHPPEIAIGVHVYTAVIGIMLWRALCNFNWDLYKSGQWKPLSGAIGATLFVISDTAIAVSAFRGRFLGSNYFIMSTYYGAQLALALTATKTRNPHKYRNN